MVEAEVEVGGKLLRALLLELPNACILLICEGDLRLGTLALAMPRAPYGPPGPTSSPIIGHRHSLTARMLAERLANLVGKIALVSLRAEGPEAEVGARALEALKKVLEERGGT